MTLTILAIILAASFVILAGAGLTVAVPAFAFAGLTIGCANLYYYWKRR